MPTLIGSSPYRSSTRQFPVASSWARQTRKQSPLIESIIVSPSLMHVFEQSIASAAAKKGFIKRKKNFHKWKWFSFLSVTSIQVILSQGHFCRLKRNFRNNNLKSFQNFQSNTQSFFLYFKGLRPIWADIGGQKVPFSFCSTWKAPFLCTTHIPR